MKTSGIKGMHGCVILVFRNYKYPEPLKHFRNL